MAPKLVTGPWRRLVYGGQDGEPGLVDHRAYVFCVLEHLHRSLRRRDVFAVGSDRWGDPRARLLSGEAWEAAKPEMLRALRLPEQPGPHLEELASELDQAYRGVASRLGSNPALKLVADGQRPSLDRLEAEAEPASLVVTEVTANRAAGLAVVAEAAAAGTGATLRYVIGTEVPAPGGARDEISHLTPTTPEALAATLGVHRRAFAGAGVQSVYDQVIVAVARPGVEFDDQKVVVYRPEAAKALSASLANLGGIVFEAHSTD